MNVEYDVIERAPRGGGKVHGSVKHYQPEARNCIKEDSTRQDSDRLGLWYKARSSDGRRLVAICNPRL